MTPAKHPNNESPGIFFGSPGGLLGSPMGLLGVSCWGGKLRNISICNCALRVPARGDFVLASNATRFWDHLGT